MILVSIWICLLGAIVFDYCGGDTKFAVTMTVIPPRFKYLEGTIQSWMDQSIKPMKLIIFVPNYYKRFKRKSKGLNEVKNSDHLESVLLKSHNIGMYVRNGTVQVVAIEQDFGPATKFMGLLWYHQRALTSVPRPDYWVVGDDDVGYSKSLLSKYDLALSRRSSTCLKMKCTDRFGMTQFAETYRLQFKLTNVNADGHVSVEPHIITHVQGVDTFIIPSFVVQDVLNFEEIRKVVDYYHSKCPESFYQDDYVISFLLHVYNVEMTSIRMADDMSPTYPIEGVTKSNSQMHTDRKVNYREEVTKRCILDSVQYVYSVTNVN